MFVFRGFHRYLESTTVPNNQGGFKCDYHLTGIIPVSGWDKMGIVKCQWLNSVPDLSGFMNFLLPNATFFYHSKWVGWAVFFSSQKPQASHTTNHRLVGGFNPVEKYARQIGSFPQVGVKIKSV